MLKAGVLRLGNKETSGIHVSADVLFGMLLKGPIED